MEPTISQASGQTSRQLTVSEADALAYQDIMSSWPRLGFGIFYHRATDNAIMDLASRPWMVAPYKDNSDHIILKKASQIGATELMLCELFNLAAHGTPVLYVLPTDRWRNEFVANRIDKLINRVPFYSSHCESTGVHKKDIQARGMKSLFGTTCKFAGSNQVRNFFEIPIGALIVDEFDQCNQQNLIYANDRLGAAKKPITRILGNPTIGGSGIDGKFAKSDGKNWWTICGHCGRAQRLDWFSHFVVQVDGKYQLRDNRDGFDADAICVQCAEPFDRCGVGEWRPEQPDSKISGYHLSRLFADARRTVPVIRGLFAEWVAAQANMTALQRFYNNVLGESFEASGVKLTDSVLSGCVDDGYLPQFPKGVRVCGADIGTGLHYRIDEIRDGKTWFVAAGVASDYADLSSICAAYKVSVGVLDAGPEIHSPREFVRSRAGWYLCRYNLSDKLVAGKKTSHKDMHVDYVEKAVSVNRTESLDGLFSDYQNGLVVLPSHYAAIEDGAFARQLKVPTRIREERPDGTFRYVWTKGEDHFFHASNYARIAGRIYNSGWNILA